MVEKICCPDGFNCDAQLSSPRWGTLELLGGYAPSPRQGELHRWGVVVCSNPVDETWRIRGICIVNFPPFSSVLIETEMSSFSIFSSNSYRKKWKYWIRNRLSLTFMVFIKVHIELRNKNDENVISYSQKKKIKNISCQ